MVKILRKYKKKKTSKKNNRRRTKRLKSRKKIIQRGAAGYNPASGRFEIKITAAMIYEYERLGWGSQDCCPCAFRLLGLPEHIIQGLKEQIDFKQMGMVGPLIIELFNQTYQNTLFEFKKFPFIPPLQVVFDIFRDIGRGHATLGSFDHLTGGHCIVFAKGNDGTLHLYDAQKSQYRRGAELIVGYFNEWKTSTIYKLTWRPKSQVEDSRIMLPLEFNNPWIYTKSNESLIKNIVGAYNLNSLIFYNHQHCFGIDLVPNGRFFLLVNRDRKPLGFLSEEISSPNLEDFNLEYYGSELIKPLLDELNAGGVRSIWSVCRIKIEPINWDLFYKTEIPKVGFKITQKHNAGVCTQLLKMYIEKWMLHTLERYLYLWVRTQQGNINYGAIKCYLRNGFRFVVFNPTQNRFITFNAIDKYGKFYKYNKLKFAETTILLLRNPEIIRLTTQFTVEDGENSLMIFERPPAPVAPVAPVAPAVLPTLPEPVAPAVLPAQPAPPAPPAPPALPAVLPTQ